MLLDVNSEVWWHNPKHDLLFFSIKDHTREQDKTDFLCHRLWSKVQGYQSPSTMSAFTEPEDVSTIERTRLRWRLFKPPFLRGLSHEDNAAMPSNDQVDVASDQGTGKESTENE